MSTAIWLLDYSVAGDSLDSYLDWFHGVHVPEKLARAGYTWAAHYRVVEAQPQAERSRFLGMFGGETPRVFFDPSPAQLKLRQNDETRNMMGLRIDGRSTVYCEEWESHAGGNATRSRRDLLSPVLRVERYEADGHEEDLAAWCAQEHVPHFAGSDGCSASRKLIAAAGGPRHLVVHELNSIAAAQDIAASEPLSEWGQRIDASVSQPFGPALIAERIWPL
jgi:hypothetical protein